MYDFFVSHSSVNKKDIVDDLVNVLQNMGYIVWYDKNEILAGDNILEAVKKGLSHSYCLILVLTSDFMKSQWTLYETGEFSKTSSNRIIPLVYNISKNEINMLLNIIGNRKYLDMSVLTKEEMSTNLIKALNQTKKENIDIQTIENLADIQKKLVTYEIVNFEIISIKLKEYLDFLDKHSDFLTASAQNIVKIVSIDLLKLAKCTTDSNIDNTTLFNLLEKNNIGNLNVREYIKFILQINGEKNVYNYISIINRALLNILTYYINLKYPTNFSFSDIEIVYPEELTLKDFEDMLEIDKRVMRADLIANVDTTYGWFQYNKYTHIGVRDKTSKKLVGYFAALPVTDETYNQIISGEFEDKNFTPDDIEQYNFSNFYRVYIAGVGIEPEYQNTGAFIKLYNAFIDMILSLVKYREIYISEILAEASTKQGEKFCKMIGMKKISNTNNETDIYKLVTIPPEFRLKNQKGKELYNLCQKRYEEYRDFFENI